MFCGGLPRSHKLKQGILARLGVDAELLPCSGSPARLATGRASIASRRETRPILQTGSDARKPTESLNARQSLNNDTFVDKGVQTLLIGPGVRVLAMVLRNAKRVKVRVP